jgi:predicted dinucleotide-binding enzyme
MERSNAMEIAVIGTGFIGGVLGNALTDAGHVVRFGSRHPDDDEVTDGPDAVVVPVPEALVGADAVILALPGSAVPDLVSTHGSHLSGQLVIDATNRMGLRCPTVGPTCRRTCATPGPSTP